MSSPNTLAVELAYPLTINGQAHKPDDTVELPAEDARQLVRDGYARWPGTSTPQQPTTGQEA